MDPKLKIIILLSILLNIVLIVLPIYDTNNIFAWIRQGLEFQRSFPTYKGALNPAAFFISIIIVPISFIYSIFQSLYLSVLILKLLLLLFFYMFTFLVYLMLKFYSLNDRFIIYSLILILFNPGIIFVTFVWSELDIIPVFFVTLSYYVYLTKPLNKNVFNILISAFSLMISIFFFLYPLILIPTYVIYSKTRKERLEYLSIFFVLGLSFEYIQINFFQGHIYNYFGSLTGSSVSLAPSTLQSGLFNYLHIYGIYGIILQLVLILIVAIIAPLYLHYLKYSSPIAMYLILSLFIFISRTINMDNFLFVLPFIFLAGICKGDCPYSKIRLFLVNCLLYLPAIFAPIIYTVQNVYGIFYWLFPLAHINGPSVSTELESKVFLPSYNLTFLIFLILSIFIVLSNPKTPEEKVKYYYFTLRPKDKSDNNLIRNRVIAIILVVILVGVSFSFSYNNFDNSVSINRPNNFPILYFYPEINQNSSIYLPINTNSYSLNKNVLSIPSSLSSLLIERNLSNQIFYLNASLFIKGYLAGPIAFSNQWAIEDNIVFENELMKELMPSIENATTMENISSPILSNSTEGFSFIPGSSILYHVASSYIRSHKLLWVFNELEAPISQSDPFYVIVGNQIIELALYQKYAFIANYNDKNGWSQSEEIPVVRSSLSEGNWNYVTLFIKNNTFFVGFKGLDYSTGVPFSNENITIQLGSPFGISLNPFDGLGTTLLSYNTSMKGYYNQLALYFNNTSKVINSLSRNLEKLQFMITDSLKGEQLFINGFHFNTRSAQYLIIGKAGGNGSLCVSINDLRISYTNHNNYFLIPAFLSFFFPLVFSIFTIFYIRKCR